MAKVMLDAGHGGSDPGACLGSRKEAADVLRVALRVGQILSANGITCGYTRTNDVYESVNQKAREGNQFGADLFVSFHRNAFNGSARGFESLVYSNTGMKANIGNWVNGQMAGLGFANRGNKVRTNLAVLRATNMEAILFEIGFIDNPSDNTIFDGKFEQICQILAKGIMQGLGVNGGSIPSPSPAPAPSPAPSPSTASWYTVAKGDTLTSIAKNHTAGLTAKRLAELNGISDPNKIKVGQKIRCDDYLAGKPTPSPSPSRRCYILSVSALQKECNRQGWSKQKVDGIPGPNTLKGCPNLYVGRKGNITKMWQQAMNNAGYNCGTADGSFGQNTKNGTMAFQRAMGIGVDGSVGPITWSKALGLS